MPALHVEIDGYRLGSWVNEQRNNRNNGKVAADRAARLEQSPDGYGMHAQTLV